MFTCRRHTYGTAQHSHRKGETNKNNRWFVRDGATQKRQGKNPNIPFPRPSRCSHLRLASAGVAWLLRQLGTPQAAARAAAGKDSGGGDAARAGERLGSLIFTGGGAFLAAIGLDL